MFTIKGTIKGHTNSCPCSDSIKWPTSSPSCSCTSEPLTIRFDETEYATVYTKTRVWKKNVVNITCSFGHDLSTGDMYPDSECMFGCIFPRGTLASILKRVYDYDYEPEVLGSTNVYTFNGLIEGLEYNAVTLKVVKNDKKVIFIMREDTCSVNRGPIKRQHIDHPRIYDSIKLLNEKPTYTGNYEMVLFPGTHWHRVHLPIGTYDRLVKLIHNIGDEDHGVDLLGL